MNVLTISLSPTEVASLISPACPKRISLLLFQANTRIRYLGFCCPKALRKSATGSSQFQVSYKPSGSLFPVEPQLSDAEEDDYDEDDDDDEAADEYDDVSAGVSDGLEESEDEIEASMAAENVPYRLEEFRWQRVEKLLNEVREFGEEIIDVDELASVYDFRIDKFQRLAIQAFLRGSSVVVSAPTSSGKTLIAEAAAVATVARGRRIFYTTPLKALSNQKFREFRETFGDSLVGLLTGDSAVNRDAQVLIMTTEILRNMMYQSVGMPSSGNGLLHVDVVVLDEVHYLSDICRGTVWEEIVIYCPKEVQLICLSATVANPDELAGWIGQIHGKTELVTSSKRPVPLNWHFSTRRSLLPLLDEKGTGMNRKLSLKYLQLHASGAKSYKDDKSRRRNFKKRDYELNYSSNDSLSGQSPLSKNDVNTIRRSQVPQVRDTLWHLKAGDMLPAIWFIFSRKGCDAAVQYLEDSNLLDECEKSEVELALKRFRIQYPDAVRDSALKSLLQGVAAHHAGCLPLWKSFIEELFQKGLVKIVFATETLAAGINMPARTAVIASLSKRGESGHICLSPNELLQMAGRAGRRGTDERGNVVLVQTPFEGAEQCCKLLFAGVEPLVSQFTASYGMVLNLLAGAKVTCRSNEPDDKDVFRARRTLEEARKLVDQSFGNYVGSNVLLASKEELNKIQKEVELLTMEVGDDAIDRKSRKLLSGKAYKEIADLQEELRAEKRLRSEMRRRMELMRISTLKPLLNELENGNLPFVCLQYRDTKGVQHKVAAVYLGKVDSFNGSKVKKMALQMSQAYAVECYKEQRNKVSRLKKRIARTEGFKEYKKIIDMTKLIEEKIKRLKARSNRLISRMEQIEPSGWKEFLQISNVIHETRALDINSHVIFPLGETAAAIRGENELWLAMVLRNKILLDLKPAQLAAVCGSLVSEGIKVRPWKNNSYIYEPSTTVLDVISFLDEQRSSLFEIQEKHGVKILCGLDSQFSGMVEAWGSGLTWREIMMDCAMDEGDLARLLRRTIDLLAQIPKLPDIDPLLQSTAMTASNVMDRPPISELAG
ncbi:DExH-box ATP-dependent RNA helicase DExH15 chloroplastic isoform X2 [Malania oleifera]|uniref:DExH-box ATP-dependent RNA helicase DExH15 chloroplastic isoform X2 n=1 Tax=Malania oleifera TaxID=397392 RepID=UPI0025ADD1CE|nr:DExH-box ATP-dependent RNA helicase DExH15 chloroplastic isoform X2 [Malania oleifera]